MKPLVLILIMTLATGLNSRAADDPFAQAQAAYDAGHYDEAAGLYESMLSNGVVNAEVHYNLANAFFKSGDLPKAVWHYRTAWYQDPHDPDINANLHFALSAAGAIEPAPSAIKRFFTSLPAGGWETVALGGYLALCALILAAILIRQARVPLLKLAMIPAAVLLLAGGGWWQWRQYRVHPECVVVHAGVTALYAPVAGGTAYYRIPMGALISRINIDPKGWIEVEYDGKAGWIKEDNILSLSP